MSGGHFNYSQYQIRDIADSIKKYVEGEVIESDKDLKFLCRYAEEEDRKYMEEHMHTKPNPYEFSNETISEFRKGIEALRVAEIYAQRIDWLLSGDDGEEDFHKSLKAELDNIDKQIDL